MQEAEKMTQASMRTFVDKVKRQQRTSDGRIAVQDKVKSKRSLIPPQEAGVRAAKIVIERFQRGLAKLK